MYSKNVQRDESTRADRLSYFLTWRQEAETTKVETIFLAADVTVASRLPQDLRKQSEALILIWFCIDSSIFLPLYTFTNVQIAGVFRASNQAELWENCVTMLLNWRLDEGEKQLKI